MEYGQLKPDGYIPRIVDRQLERMLATFGAVEVAGTMWCGKTWTSLAFERNLGIAVLLQLQQPCRRQWHGMVELEHGIYVHED